MVNWKSILAGLNRRDLILKQDPYIEDEDDLINYLLDQGAKMTESGEFAKALEIYREILKVELESHNAWYNIGHLHWDQAQYC